jgi:hypothetical protein
MAIVPDFVCTSADVAVQERSIMTTTHWILLAVAVPIVVGGVWFFFLRKSAPKEEPILHFQCPHCRRKLRYKSRQAGHAGLCPRCHKNLTFPMSPGAPGQARKA